MPFIVLATLLVYYLSIEKVWVAIEPSTFDQSVTWWTLVTMGAFSAGLAIFPVPKSTRVKREVTPFSRSSRCESFFIVTWFLISLFLSTQTAWISWVEYCCPFSMAIQYLIALSPVLVSLSIIWWTEELRQFGRWHLCVKNTIFRIKVQILTLLIPVTLAIALKDLTFNRILNLSPHIQFLCFLTGTMILIIMMPAIVCRILPTESIKDTKLGEHLIRLAKSANTPVLDVRLWNTNDRLINALIIGLGTRNRIVLLSDRLIRQFERAEIESIYLHELGHANKKHLLQRLLTAVICFAFTFTICLICKLPSSLSLGLSMSLSWLGMTWIAHLLEFEADQFAAEQLVLNHSSPVILQQTLTKIMLDNPRTDRFSWLHPSISSRIQQIRELNIRYSQVAGTEFNRHPDTAFTLSNTTTDTSGE